VELFHLGARSAYRARWFDPVTGLTSPLGEIRGDENGRWHVESPAGLEHDWVLILEPKKGGNQAGSGRSAKSKLGALVSAQT
jgi:hypothetical protein